MLSSRKLLRREFFSNFLSTLAFQLSRPSNTIPNRRYQLGNRVISYRICDDDRSPSYGGVDWETGIIVGYCFQFDEWRDESFTDGWTYFIRYDQTNNSDFTHKPCLDFEHETRIIKI